MTKPQVKAGVFTAEGFISGLALQFENGLVLRTNQNILWCGQEERQKTINKFCEIVDLLGQSGFEVERSSLDEALSTL